MKCDICGKEYRRAGWLSRHRHVLGHWTPGKFVMQYDPGIVDQPLTLLMRIANKPKEMPW